MHARVLRFASLVVSLLSLGVAAARGQTEDDLSKLRQQAQQLFNERKYVEALAAQRTVAAGVEKLETTLRRAPGKDTTNELLDLSWYALFARAPGEALKASERAHRLAPESLPVDTNRAHALLFLRRTREAQRLYLAYKGKRLVLGSDKTWEDSIVEDFDALRRAGIAHAAFSMIVAQLGIRHPELNAEIEATRKTFDRLYGSGQYEEGAAAAETLIDLTRQRFGEERTEFAAALDRLAMSKQRLRLVAEAEALFKRSLTIRETALGPEHPDVAASLNNLADAYWRQGRRPEAEQAYKRLLAIREKTLGPDHLTLADALNALAGVYAVQQRFAEAEPLYKRSLAIEEKVLGLDHPKVASTLFVLAKAYRENGRYAEAEQLLRRSVAIRGESDPSGSAELAELYLFWGRYSEAESLYKRLLAFGENLREPAPPLPGVLSGLASIYEVQGRYAEAEPLLKRELADFEREFGPDAAQVSPILSELALLYVAQRRYVDAEPLFKRSLANHEKELGPNHIDVGASSDSLGDLYRAQGRYAEAEPLLRRGLAVREKALGPDHLFVGYSLINLGDLHRAKSQYSEAKRIYERGLTILERALGPDHVFVARSLSRLAQLAYEQSGWARAADYWRRSTDIIRRRAERRLPVAAEEWSKIESQQSSDEFAGLVRATYRLASDGTSVLTRNTSLGLAGAAMFETAQWAQASEAAASLAQMAARSAKGSTELAELTRERQDLANELQMKDKLRTAGKVADLAMRGLEAEKTLAERLAAIDARLAEVDQRLALDFPNYNALARPAPLSIEDVQTQLRADEALVLFLDTPERKPLPEETFVWVVTKSEARWVRSDLGTEGLKREVAALRCGLDDALWDDKDSFDRCKALVKAERRDSAGYGNVLPFDLARAHALYKALLGLVEGLIEGKHLLIVPSGALMQLPFQVLVTAPPDAAIPDGPGGYRAAAWLGARQPITVLPAVSSLRALRRVGRPSAAPRPMIGFGNPLLDGYPGSPGDSPSDKKMAEDHARWRAEARARQHCEPAGISVATSASQGPQRVASGARAVRGVARMPTRGGLADLDLLKAQVPLPETADELCKVAEAVQADAREIRLGADATEREVKRLSASGELARYRMLHFATHGAAAGELRGTDEPGIILTPPAPEARSEEDDGYLSASEIAGLKLDADWVILSACNTAAGSAASAEALSGLARAFIYAGARALLVSHWSVNSDTTAELVKTAVAEMARNPKVGRAEAMRHAMAALIDKGTPDQAHPSYWAPFVVVGEGAARQ